MGSRSDRDAMQDAARILDQADVPCEVEMVSAHRTPDRLIRYAEVAEPCGIDSLLLIVQMPAGIPVGTLAIGNAGAKNAALLAISILGVNDPRCRLWQHGYRMNRNGGVVS